MEEPEALLPIPSPCVQCGACCSHFRVSFYWAEGEGLPSQLVQARTAVLACLRGTDQAKPRCAALEGTVGQSVRCTVYDQRPSPCRELQAGDGQCARARQVHGLLPLSGVALACDDR